MQWIKWFFVSIGPKMASKISSVNNKVDYISCASKSFFCEPCTELEVFQEINALNDKKAIGIENIPIKFLKIAAEITTALISKLLNKCIQKSVFPSNLKIAKVIR